MDKAVNRGENCSEIHWRVRFKSVDATRYTSSLISQAIESTLMARAYMDIFYCLRAADPPLKLVFPAGKPTALYVL